MPCAMKFLVQKNLLKTLTHNPMTVIEPGDIAEVLETDEHNNFPTPELSSSFNIIGPSHAFAAPATPLLRRQTDPFAFIRTPSLGQARLINLSYSQPSSPRTPFPKNRKESCQTPRRPAEFTHGFGGESFVPSTPMIADPLKTLQLTTSSFPSCNGSVPDILQLIDDESGPVEALERQLNLFSDVALTDETVVEYLLDLSVEQQQTKANNQTVQEQSTATTEPAESVPKRKCRRGKPMSMEEMESLKRLSKEKSRQRFKKPAPKGSRQGTRVRKKTTLFSAPH